MEKKEQEVHYPTLASPSAPATAMHHIRGSEYSAQLAGVHSTSAMYPSITPQAPTVVMTLGPHPARITCPQCGETIITRTHKENNFSAHLCCFLMFLCVCTLPCSCIPYCMDSFKIVNHTCPSCGNFLGTYKP